MSKNLLKLNHDQIDFQGKDDLRFLSKFCFIIFHPPGFFRQEAAHTRKGITQSALFRVIFHHCFFLHNSTVETK